MYPIPPPAEADKSIPASVRLFEMEFVPKVCSNPEQVEQELLSVTLEETKEAGDVIE